MKLKNAVIGKVVQIKDIHEYPTDCCSRTCYEYGVNIEEHEGVIVFEPDSDGDVCVYSSTIGLNTLPSLNEITYMYTTANYVR